jgi:V/A-type H+/Na+-transporting ATPase subunit K
MSALITFGVAALLAAGILLIQTLRSTRNPLMALRAVVAGLLSLNGLALLACLGIAVVALANPTPVLAQEAQPAAPAADGALGAALATGLACIGAGIAVGIAGAAAIGGITEKPEILGRTLIFVGLAEGIAIYGLIISFLILNR